MQQRNIQLLFVDSHRRSHGNRVRLTMPKFASGAKTMNKRRSSIFAVLGFSLIAYSSSVRAEQEFTDLVAKVMPSVVNIAIEAMGQRVKLEQSGGDLAYATYVVEYVGAGSIVDPSGLIITNRHVVKDAYEIDVTLSDGATFKGQLLGAGSGTDLAILKIDAGRPLPALEIGNSNTSSFRPTLRSIMGILVALS